MSLYKTKALTLTALLFALALVLSIVESSFPPLFTATPGIKLGLSNIIVMYALFFLSKKHAFMIAILKAGFVYITRGAVAGLLSFCGGTISLMVMILLMVIFKDKVSYLILSIFGAVFHNIGQLLAVSFVYTSIYLLMYLPILLISGVVAGMATSTLLRFILPAFKKLS